MKKSAKIFLFLALLCLTVWLFRSGLLHELTFDNLKARQGDLRQWTQEHFLKAILAYFTIYVLSTALSIPGATVLTLAGGGIFGLLTGTVIVSFASTLGATLCFIGARFFLRDFVILKFSSAYDSVEKGLAKEGPFYLFTLRLIPAVPFFVINLVFGLTRMRAGTFWIVSQIGMLPGTLVYVNAGTQLSKIESPRGILSLPVILSLALLGLLPWLGKYFRKVRPPL